jgi:branched-chain amino acid transport system ATP-binding protein
VKVLELGDKGYLLVSWEVRYEGDPRILLSHPQFSRLYLGILR